MTNRAKGRSRPVSALINNNSAAADQKNHFVKIFPFHEMCRLDIQEPLSNLDTFDPIEMLKILRVLQSQLKIHTFEIANTL